MAASLEMQVDHPSSTATVETIETWPMAIIAELFALPLPELIWRAASVHRQHHDPTRVQYSILLSAKTGACPEDCKYCSQSGHHNTNIKKERFVSVDTVERCAKQAKANGATRFCFAAAWRGPSAKEFPAVLDMVKAVNALGLESCASLGKLTEQQAAQLKQAGLDYYNHNIDTSPEHYANIVSTHTFDERLQTLQYVREAGINVCSGGILGMGETRADRASFIHQLANLATPPESVPINQLVPIPGTPLADTNILDPIEFVRTIAVARITMPTSYVRLSAGRHTMSDELQALCFIAGANSVHGGEKLLTTPLKGADTDRDLFQRLGMHTDKVEYADAV